MAAVRTREIALEILLEVLERDGMGHLVLRQALEKYGYLEKQERSFLTRLVNGTMAKVIELDAIVSCCSSIPPRKMKPVVRNILRMTAYQLKYMDSVPASAACNEAVKLAERKGFRNLKGFVNGVSRSMARELDTMQLPDTPQIRYSLPDWLVETWTEMYGAQTVEEIGAGFAMQEERSRETMVRCNSSLADTGTIIELLQAEGVTVRRHEQLPEALLIGGYDRLDQLEAFARGWIQVQDGSSMLVAAAAAPKQGDTCIDVCAAPGGKSLHLADLLQGTGRVISCDVSFEKVALIEENCMRCGFENIEPQVQDALEYREDWKETADVLIADLPCSGLGIMGGKPDIRYKASAEKCQELAALQRSILDNVWQYVKPGGTLIYSTCTIHKNENEDNASYLAAHYPFEIVSLEGMEGVPQAAITKEGFAQILPGQNGMAGFFIAKLRRKHD